MTDRHEIYFYVKNKDDNVKLLEAMGFTHVLGKRWHNGDAYAPNPWSNSVHIWCDKDEYESFQKKAQASGLLSKEHGVNTLSFEENVENMRTINSLVETHFPSMERYE